MIEDKDFLIEHIKFIYEILSHYTEALCDTAAAYGDYRGVRTFLTRVHNVPAIAYLVSEKRDDGKIKNRILSEQRYGC